MLYIYHSCMSFHYMYTCSRLVIVICSAKSQYVYHFYPSCIHGYPWVVLTYLWKTSLHYLFFILLCLHICFRTNRVKEFQSAEWHVSLNVRTTALLLYHLPARSKLASLRPITFRMRFDINWDFF